MHVKKYLKMMEKLPKGYLLEIIGHENINIDQKQVNQILKSGKIVYFE
jgi:hypothetical protein